MSFAFDLYVDRASWLHRLDPRTKLAFVAFSSILLLSLSHPFASAAFLLGIHGVLWSGKVPASRLRWAWQRMWPITFLILVLWPIFYPQGDEVLWQVWQIRITTQGLWQGLSIALRVDALAFAFLVLLFSTDQARLVRSLVKLGLPYEWGLTLAIALRYLPTLYGIYATVSEAQQARGWVIGEGNFVRRIKSYLPILVAVIVTSLRLADNLSMALAARGFQSGVKRTYLRELELSLADKVCLPLFAVSLIVFLIVRFV
ncbi:MAG: energy-coupling factor transporter transmembrane protein EcfT [Anaerolineales bacterium]|nr:energy-coupling factor transporter transmembrane protein EcfT [Anaerolineales bacterium]